MSMFFYFIRECLEYYIIIHYHEEPIGQRQEIERMNRKNIKIFVFHHSKCVLSVSRHVQ